MPIIFKYYLIIIALVEYVRNIFIFIFSLEYPVSQIKEHEKEIDKLLPNVENLSSLVKAARILWKKWIILKIVFKIPKLDRPKEEGISYKIVIIFHIAHY